MATVHIFHPLILKFLPPPNDLAAKLREACFDPGNVMNGTRIGADYKLGSMVTFNCEAGYLLQGYSTLTCVMGSSKRPEWDRAKPSCQGERRRWCVSRMAWRSRLRSSCGAQYLILCDSATQLGKKNKIELVCACKRSNSRSVSTSEG